MILPPGYRPAFNVCGMETGHGVRLFASRALLTADFQAHYRHQDVFAGYGDLTPAFSVLTGAEFELRCRMGRVLVIEAPDWPTAFARMADAWRAEDAGRRSARAANEINEARRRLTRGVPELEPGDGAE